MEKDSRVPWQQLIDELQSPISDLEELLTLLTAPLDQLGLLPPRFRNFNTHPLSRTSTDVSKYVSQIQRTVITHILPVWDTLLVEHHAMPVIEQYFCPDSSSFTLPSARFVALNAYATFVTHIRPPTAQTSIFRLLERLVSNYSIDTLFHAVFSGATDDEPELILRWEDCVKNVMVIPSKVGDALGVAGNLDEMPSALENSNYFRHLSLHCEILISQLSKATSVKPIVIEESLSFSALAYLLNKLVNYGVFPPHPPVARSQASFFEATLAPIRQNLVSNEAADYTSFWSRLLLALPSNSSLRSVLTSLFAELRIPETIEPPTGPDLTCRARVRHEAALLEGLMGKLNPCNEELWEVCTTLMTSNREWHESYARVFVCWISGGSRDSIVNTEALGALLEVVHEVWSSPEHIKHSVVFRHRYMTSLFVLTISYFPQSSKHIRDLLSNPNFIKAIGTYISHADPSIRRCGMIGAEIAAHACGQKLDFGGWDDGDEHGKSWCRSLRHLVQARDVDTVSEEIRDTGVGHTPKPNAQSVANLEDNAGSLLTNFDSYDSDDSVTGYASSPSTRCPSPSSQELAEIEKDPALNVGIQTAPRPVYLAQLRDLLRGKPSLKGGDGAPHEADMIKAALDSAEGLIRKKRVYGTELDENAIDLVYALLSLQDNYDTEGFSHKRQNALNALVACCPRKAAPALIQEFFKNQYSVDQRFAALTALALGARELASLPVMSGPSNGANFPSKMLPPGLHHKYINTHQDSDGIPWMAEELSRGVFEKQGGALPETAPPVLRERHLRIRRPDRVTEAVGPFASQPSQKLSSPRFIDVASEFFIMPLINNFWTFMRDEQTREERTSHLEGRSRYSGAGTGLILNALVLSHLVGTLAVLVHASQNAPEWLDVVAPESLELALTLGLKPVSLTERQEDNYEEDGAAKEASLITSALELAVIVLDCSIELDGGKTLSLEYTSLLLGIGDWAGRVLTWLEKGFRVAGLGGSHETKLKRAAAGVLLKVDEVTSKWKRSMLDYV